MSTSNEARAEQVDAFLGDIVADLAGANPAQSITLVVACGKFHSDRKPSFNWSMRIGHAPMIDAASYHEVVEKAAHAISPAAKLERAAALRKEAEALELAANSQA